MEGEQTGRGVGGLRRRVQTLEEAPSAATIVGEESRARVGADRALATDLDTEAAARGRGDKANADAISAEATARAGAVKAVADGLASEIQTARKAEADGQARIVSLGGTLSLAAGLTVVVGKTERKVAVAGLKKGDGITVTPASALPGNMTLGDAYCLADGELTLSTIVTGTLALSISAKADIPLIVKALR